MRVQNKWDILFILFICIPVQLALELPKLFSLLSQIVALSFNFGIEICQCLHYFTQPTLLLILIALAWFSVALAFWPRFYIKILFDPNIGSILEILRQPTSCKFKYKQTKCYCNFVPNHHTNIINNKQNIWITNLLLEN